MKQYVAHLAKGASGLPLSCSCTEYVTCGNCVQVNLLSMEKRFKAEDEAVKSFIGHARKHGIRRTAREIGEHEKSLRRWIDSGNIPAEVLRKFTSPKTDELTYTNAKLSANSH